jgi:hypothetical protein
MVVHTCNPSTGRLRQEVHVYKASLGYMVRLTSKAKTNQNEKDSPRRPSPYAGAMLLDSLVSRTK